MRYDLYVTSEDCPAYEVDMVEHISREATCYDEVVKEGERFEKLYQFGIYSGDEDLASADKDTVESKLAELNIAMTYSTNDIYYNHGAYQSSFKDSFGVLDNMGESRLTFNLPAAGGCVKVIVRLISRMHKKANDFWLNIDLR